MIDEVLSFLKDQLNAALLAGSDGADGGSQEDRVVFPEGEKLRESIEFKIGAVTALLVDLQEETTLRPGDRYVRVDADGMRQKTAPEIRLNLHVLFVSHFKSYSDSLKNLSGIIQFFQGNRVFNHASAPGLSEKVDQLVVELVTLTFAEQNEIWSALRTSPRPSALYTVRMIVFQQRLPQPAARLDEAELRLHS